MGTRAQHAGSCMQLRWQLDILKGERRRRGEMRGWGAPRRLSAASCAASDPSPSASLSHLSRSSAGSPAVVAVVLPPHALTCAGCQYSCAGKEGHSVRNKCVQPTREGPECL